MSEDIYTTELILFRGTERIAVTPSQIAEWWHAAFPDRESPSRQEVIDWINDPAGLNAHFKGRYPSQRFAFNHVMGAINRIARERAEGGTQ